MTTNTNPTNCEAPDLGRTIAAILYAERSAALARRAAHELSDDGLDHWGTYCQACGTEHDGTCELDTVPGVPCETRRLGGVLIGTAYRVAGGYLVEVGHFHEVWRVNGATPPQRTEVYASLRDAYVRADFLASVRMGSR